MRCFRIFFILTLFIFPLLGMEQLPLRVQAQDFMVWHWLEFSGEPKLPVAMKLGLSHFKTATEFKKAHAKMRREQKTISQGEIDTRVYHTNAAFVYYLYVVYYTKGKTDFTAMYHSARNSLIELARHYGPSDTLVDCACYPLGYDEEFLNLYEEYYQVHGGCTLL